MRYSIYIFFIFLGVLVACDSSKDKEDKKVNLMKADWSDTTAIAKAIDVYYKDSVIKKGNVSLPVRDAFLRSAHPYQYLQIQKIQRQEFKETSPTIGYMPVLMTSTPNIAVVDFQITWQQISPNDSLGRFVVTDVFVQKVNEQLRYEWVKEDNNYWIRKTLEVTPPTQPGRQSRSGLNINPEDLKKK